MKHLLSLLCGLLAAALLAGCTAAPQAGAPGSGAPSSSQTAASTPAAPEEETSMKLSIQINGRSFTATLADTAAAQTLAGLLQDGGPLTLELRNYGGFEKVGPLGVSLPASDSQTTTSAGDIVLYQGDQLVLFYGSNSWSYTRLARVDDLTGWEDALGSGDVTVTLSLAG